MDGRKMSVEVTCTDGTFIVFDKGITSVREDINRYIEEYRMYKDLLTIRHVADGADNLWDLKYQLLNKKIHNIAVKETVTDPESHITTTNCLQEWTNVNYWFHGAYREIHHATDGSVVNEIVTVLITDIKQN